MIKKLQKFTHWLHALKFDRKAIIVLIVLDILMAFGSNFVDWPWLLTVAKSNPYLIPFAPICSLYPLTLAIWFIIYYKNGPHGYASVKTNVDSTDHKIKRQNLPPAWLTTFIFIGITSYGVMSLIYFPLYMSWYGFELRTVGNMLWVVVYALQSFIIASELKPVPLYQYALIIAYFVFKDYADRFLGTFWDLLDPNYPAYILTIASFSIVILHISFITLAIKLGRRNTGSPGV